MKIRYLLATAFLSVGMLLAGSATAKSNGSKDASAKEAPANAPAAATTSVQDEDLRLEGEKRFRANCGRCHTAPTKFAPRMAATIVRHMRVRANITDDDRRLILRYMAQ